ncbi:hypothetical protein EDI_201410 [Entamoeba dispar SAW760]|uniref:Uncharacterized protein n=1 Tax=Entamoeba dispar (strain ATCC PRA-260 / SAW760) TaxID=370354 RepID=B0ETU9_ENTDS|nr:uncharacterized protein EDI_201410 [Entamoeba dispar SAW760]EDR22025.1 hypothetical protein EDI_201410 [Entamoeba dispar SAW760]|eukprot:EDR22025.1 hypothetical protein EDI_201410 [Entamoeba dispar SAW760]
MIEVKDKPTSLSDLNEETILKKTLLKEIDNLYHKKEVEPAILSDTENIKTIVKHYEKQVDSIMEHVLPVLEKRFRLKPMLIDRYGETHRQDVLRLFVHYNKSYFQFIEHPLGNVKYLYLELFKSYDFTERKCYYGVIFVLKYMMILDLMRKNMIIGNVRLFRSTTKFVSSIEIVKQTIELAFETPLHVYDTLCNFGYSLTQVQYPQYCIQYKLNSLDDFISSGIQLSVLATYLADQRLGITSNIINSLVLDNDQLLTRRQATSNINHLVGFLNTLGMPFKIGEIAFYDYSIYEREDTVVSLFLFEFLRVFQCQLVIPIHVVCNEISRIGETKISLSSSNDMYEAWVSVIGNCYNKVFTYNEFEYFLPYLYIVCYYSHLSIPTLSHKGDGEKRRIEIIKAMQPGLEILNIPKRIFTDKINNYGDKTVTNYILSFLFYFIQKNALIDCAANSIGNALKKCVERKKMKKGMLFISSIFNTINIIKGKEDEYSYNQVITGTHLIQQNHIKVLYEEEIKQTKEVQCIMKKLLLQKQMKGIWIHVKGVQSICRQYVIQNENNKLEREIKEIQSIYKTINTNAYYNQILESCLTTQSNGREMEKSQTWKEQIESNKTAQKEMRRCVDEMKYARTVEGTKSFERVFKEEIYKREFNEQINSNELVQSILRRNQWFMDYERIVNSCIETQKNAKRIIYCTKYEEICHSSTNVADALKQILHSSEYGFIKRVCPFVQSYYRSLIQTKQMKERINSCIPLEGLFRGIKGYYNYSLIIQSSVDTQKEIRRTIKQNKYQEIITSEQIICSVLREKRDHLKYSNLQEQCQIVQGLCRRRIFKEQFDCVNTQTSLVQSEMKRIIKNRVFKEIEQVSKEMSAFIKTYSITLEFMIRVKMGEEIQAVIKGNKILHKYLAIVENIKEPQSICKQIVYTNKMKDLINGIKYIQQHHYFEEIKIQCINVQSVMRRIYIPQFKENQLCCENVERIWRCEIKQRQFNKQRNSIIQCQRCGKETLKRKEYIQIIRANEIVQSYWRKVIQKHEQEEREYYCSEIQGIMRSIIVKKDKEHELSKWYQNCQYKRCLTKCCIPLQGICRQTIVKYGVNLDEEVMQSLSYSCELYTLIHSSVPLNEKQKKQKRISESPSKILQSPSQRILPKEIIMNSIYLNKTTRMSFNRLEYSKRILYEYIRKSERSIIDIAFSNIRMIERKKLEEVQIGAKQLFEQIRCSEWFRVMFVKYQCVYHILDLLKSSNKSPPYLELVEKSCTMLHFLIRDDCSFKLYNNPNMIKSTIERVSEILRNFMEIKILTEGTKVFLCLIQKLPEIKTSLIDVCQRLNTKLTEIEQKEKLEKKKAMDISVKLKKECIYEAASPHIKILVAKVIGK